MRLFDEVKGYATTENAIKKLTKELARFGRTPENTRWIVVVNSAGRFCPVVQVTAHAHNTAGLVGLAQFGVGVM